MKPTLLIVDDDNGNRKLYSQTLTRAGYTVSEAVDGADALEELKHVRPDMIISDVRMPGIDGLELLRQVREHHGELPFLLVTAHADVRGAVSALKLGAVDYLEKPVDLDELVDAVSEALGTRQPHSVPEDVPAEAMEGIIAESPSMQSLLRDVYRVAQSDANVLVLGESGTGKEVISGFIHRNSPRSAKPMVAVNCAAIPANLLASELFGHEKGAFTGATTRRAGHFREADGGTLFLDEIGDMPLELQPALLRALEAGRIKAVGSDKETTVDVRLVAATNHNLHEAVKAGRFREDLYYRLNVISFTLPSLSERPEDIVPLTRFFMEPGKRLSPASSRSLQQHSWPGNIRELANAVKRACILSSAEVILPEHLPPDITRAAARTDTPSANPARQKVQTVEAAEIDAIRSALKETGGNRTRAAELLGISRRALLYKVKRYGIS